MTLVLSTDKPTYYAVSYAGAVLWADQLPVGNALATMLPVVADTDENAYLGKAATGAGAFNPLPATGQRCEAGMIYGYNGGLVICRQTHVRTNYAPADTLALFVVYRVGGDGVLAWVAGEQVTVGTQRTFGGLTYQAIQAHVTQSDWQPPAVPALWRLVVVVSPTGAWAAGVAYKIGDKVTYSGKTYQCLQAHTSIATWQPPVVPALWKLI